MDRQKKYNCCSKNDFCPTCISNEMCKAWSSFVWQHRDTKIYAHFDKRVSLATPSVREYVLNEQKISRHSFYPFIHFTKKNSKFGKTTKIKTRQLYYCCHLDRCVYQRYAFLLNQAYNVYMTKLHLSDVAIAYRDNLGKNNIDFAKEAFDTISLMGKSLVYVGDFTDFFDNLDHKYLKARLHEILNVDSLPNDYYAVFKNITRFSSWDWDFLIEHTGHIITERRLRKTINEKETIISKVAFDTNKHVINKNANSYGIPQGSPISAVLSNIYMLKFDKALSDYVKQYRGFYRRYSDDFIIILPYRDEFLATELLTTVTNAVNSVDKLNLQESKTNIYICEGKKIFKINMLTSDMTNAGIDYLGFIFDGKEIKIRPKSITKYYYRMRRKAKTIALNNWCSPLGRRISAKKLYEIYSSGGEKQTFIDYAKRANDILQLTDNEAQALIKNHKQKISQAIKKAKK